MIEQNYNKRRDILKKYFLLILVLSLVLQIGCRSTKDKEIAELDETKDNLIQVSVEDKAIIDRSENLADYVVELFGIDDAAVIIFNDTALVSVIMAYDTELTQETRDLIKELVLEKDTAIKEVLISSDEKTFFQVVEVIGKLMNGSPYDNHVGEITKMIEKSHKK